MRSGQDSLARPHTGLVAATSLVFVRTLPARIVSADGQAQPVALCRALLSQPDVVLADEPSGNLDQTAATIVFEALRQAAAEGTCVILATHDPALARAVYGDLDQAISPIWGALARSR